jgi:hypothetical protein
VKFASDIGVAAIVAGTGIAVDINSGAELEAIVVMNFTVRIEEQTSGYAGFYVGDFR